MVKISDIENLKEILPQYYPLLMQYIQSKSSEVNNNR